MNTRQIKYYSVKEIAEIFAVAPNTVRSWVFHKKIPKPDIQQPRFTRWKHETISPFLDDPVAWRRRNSEKMQPENGQADCPRHDFVRERRL